MSSPPGPSKRARNEKPSASRKRKKVELLPMPTRLTTVGRVLVCGAGDLGQLGLGPDVFEELRPTEVPDLNNVVDVCAGGTHTLVLTEEGQVWSFGCNDEGVLGRDTSEDDSEYSPGLVALPGEAVMICAGDSHSACLLTDGTVVAWGNFRDSHGDMGLTLEGKKFPPTKLLPNHKCVKIASGTDHLAMLTEEGKLFTIGCAEQGQLGRVTWRTATGESRRGKVEMLEPREVVVLRNKGFIDLYTSNSCTFVKEKDTNKIYACGLNNANQLFIQQSINPLMFLRVTKFPNMKMISGGQHHTVALDYEGGVWAIGCHYYGRLGLGEVDEDIDVLTKLNGLNDEHVSDISCGERTSFAITDSGKLYGWGSNNTYQLGTGNDEDATEPMHLVTENIPEKSVLKASCGGQHSVFLVKTDNASEPATKTEAVNSKNKRTKKENESTDSNTGKPSNKRKNTTAVK